MAGISNLLGLGRDALQAQGYALGVAGQNVANASTPGYVRRSADLQTKIAGSVTYGGVYAAGLQRTADQFLDAKAYEAAGFDAQAQTRDTALSKIENLFNDTSGTGLSSSLSALFSAFGGLAVTPADTTARTTVLESARVVAERIRSASGEISSVRKDLLDQAKGVVSELNNLAAQVVDLNTEITAAQATGSDASDLRDQRDRVVSQMAKRVNVHVFTDNAGKFVVSTGGATLVEGDSSANLTISLTAEGAIQVLAKRSDGPAMDITAQVSGGTLAGIRDARDVDATEVSNRLDAFASDLASAVNAQHAEGYGLDGVNGRDLFTIASGAGAAATLELAPDMDGYPERVGAAESASALPAGSGNALALSSLSGRPISSTGRTAMEAYSDLVGDVGQRKANAAQNAELRSAILSQAKAMRESTTGVSIDEEMVSLSQYQRAYQAGAKLVQTADELLAGLVQSL